MKRSILGAAVMVAMLVSLVAIPSVTSAKVIHHGGSNISVVGYSTPGPVYINGLEPAFQNTAAGKNVTFTNSFGASDAQANNLVNGQHADVVNFSYAPNMSLLRAHHLVPSNWASNTYHGMVTDTVVAFGVRPGNPKNIKTWADLLKKGVGVDTPDTALSGSAKWNILAAYYAKYLTTSGKTSKKNAKALAYLKSLFKNIVDQQSSGSKELAKFLAGTGDVVIGYEDDIMEAQGANPGKVQLIVPPQSLLIENPLSVTLPPAAQDQAAAKKFVSFLYSKQGQTIWANNDYWPVLPSVAKHYHFPKPKKILFKVAKFSGWSKLDPKFFDPTNGIWTKIKNGG
jgi:sulfate/thiosulfate-binding protein